jgi:hypothetical protein
MNDLTATERLRLAGGAVTVKLARGTRRLLAAFAQRSRGGLVELFLSVAGFDQHQSAPR